MKKPVSFLSGYYKWTIYWSKERAEELFGKTDSSTKTITIYQCESKQIEKETLLHELLHVALEDKSDAIFNYEPESKSHDKEENLIRLLSPALMNILADNKDLAKYLFGA